MTEPKRLASFGGDEPGATARGCREGREGSGWTGLIVSQLHQRGARPVETWSDHWGAKVAFKAWNQEVEIAIFRTSGGTPVPTWALYLSAPLDYRVDRSRSLEEDSRLLQAAIRAQKAAMELAERLLREILAAAVAGPIEWRTPDP